MAYLLAAYWLGVAARLAAATAYELRRPVGVWSHVLGAAGFGVLVGAWMAVVAPLVMGWAVVLVGFGWIVGDSAARAVARRRTIS